jgi:hypothetical protein
VVTARENGSNITLPIIQVIQLFLLNGIFIFGVIPKKIYFKVLGEKGTWTLLEGASQNFAMVI